MPTIEQNKTSWARSHHWRNGGDHWSGPWGGPVMQWHASILPRIYNFLPTGTILEIAPGFGRWTEFLKELCDRLIIVDLSQNCIEACRDRFGEGDQISYHVNDGRSLDMVPDGSIDFVFSYDSLVHVEEDVIAAYLEQLARKLKPDGVGFLHHSNAGAYQSYFKWVRGIILLKLLFRILTLETKTHGRALSMSAEKFQRLAEVAGLRLIGQEMINWRSRLMLDCHSMITRADSKWGTRGLTIRNRHFMDEAGCISGIADLYGGLGELSAKTN